MGTRCVLMNERHPLRLGLVGVARQACRYLQSVPDSAKFVAYARATDEDAVLGCFEGLRRMTMVELFTRGEVDAVVVAATPAVQLEALWLGHEHHLPVLAEKPVGLSGTEVRRLLYVHCLEPRPAILTVGHTHLYAGGYQGLKESYDFLDRLPLAREWALFDKVRAVRAVDMGPGPARAFSSLRDYGPHPLSMLFDLFGIGSKVEVLAARDEVSAIGHNYVLDLRWDGVPVRVEVGSGASERQRVLEVDLVVGPTLSYAGETACMTWSVAGQGRCHDLVKAPPRAALEVQLGAFIDYVARGRAPFSLTASLVREARIAEVLDDAEWLL